ncbi:hypothetical protein GDO81_009562 [Engystomops pustulosus]|uniref:Uncharacterized protein n=2 Tax=Engystomops pustulosus TaxID=76066 RepID=A0AAV7BSK7_ENGPU|nr:hypothetical protein GDO81_009562 [Engystomops pustulosus]
MNTKNTGNMELMSYKGRRRRRSGDPHHYPCSIILQSRAMSITNLASWQQVLSETSSKSGGYRLFTSYARQPSDMKQSGLGSQCTGLFSTTVLGGSSSAPNLQDYARSYRKKISAAASLTYKDGFEGCSMVPTIYPLETLHNALSLKQVSEFLTNICKHFAETHSRRSSVGCDSMMNRHSAGDVYLPHRILSSSSLPLRHRSERPPWYSSGPSSTVSSAGPSSPTTIDLSARFNFNEKALTEEQGRKLNLESEDTSSSLDNGHNTPPTEEPASSDPVCLSPLHLCDLPAASQPCLEDETRLEPEPPAEDLLPNEDATEETTWSMDSADEIQRQSGLSEQLLTELSIHGQETSL